MGIGKFLAARVSSLRPSANRHPPPLQLQARNSQYLAPPPMAEPQSWEDLPGDMVFEVALRLPCAIDRVRMATACHAWHAVVAQAPPPPPRLPSLLLAPTDAAGVYCYLSGCRDHNSFPWPRHFGSYDGAWLFLAHGQTRGHRLHNFRTGESYALPDEITDDDDGEIHRMVVLAATLSFPPDHLECVAAGIVSYQPDLDAPRQRRFAFWRPGDELAFCTVEPEAPVGPGLEEEDVVYHLDSFHFLTQGGHIFECTPILDGDGDVLAVVSELFRFRDVGCNDGLFVRARYLVPSRGELLMVVRLALHPDEPTSSLKVFQKMHITALDSNEKEADDEYPCTWGELDALGGRMLFVGRGCSRSYEVGQYPGFKDSIFFLDDRSFYGDEMMFGGVNERQYPCSDTGMWSEGPPPHVDRYFPERVPSYNSPPAWLLP